MNRSEQVEEDEGVTVSRYGSVYRILAFAVMLLSWMAVAYYDSKAARAALQDALNLHRLLLCLLMNGLHFLEFTTNNQSGSRKRTD